MTIEKTISLYVQQQFEAFQLAEIDKGSEVATSIRIAASIEKYVHILALNDAMNKVDLNQNQKLSGREGIVCPSIDVTLFLIPTLIKYIDATLSMEIDVESGGAVKRVFNLVAALACNLSFKNKEIVNQVIDRAKTFTNAISERPRSHACTLLGCFGSHILALSTRCKSTNSLIYGAEFLTESLSTIEKILLPRLTDKSQSVRHKAIQATRVFFGTYDSGSATSYNSTIEGISSPALLEGLLWSMWHDPSPTNRIEAIEAVPIDSAETLDHVIARIRDEKEKVRNAAIHALRLKVDPRQQDIMTQEHFRDIVQNGLTERCESTNFATMSLICTKWTKAARFCPVELMRFMGATMYEEECEKALRAILQVARALSSTKGHPVLNELSDPEIRSLCSNIEKSIIRLEDSKVIFDEYQLFYTRVACSTAKESMELSSTQKEDLMTKTIPDIPTLCDLFRKHLSRFAESIQEQDDECIDQECFVCLQLLQLAKVAGLEEEGSRRHFSNVMMDVLANSETPDELVDECVEALRKTFQNEIDFFGAISVILESFSSAAESIGDDGKHHTRILLIFSVVLENATSTLLSHGLFNIITEITLAAVNDFSPTVREVGISCLGKLGLLSDETTIVSEFKPILLKIAAQKGEAMQCRGQSILILSDWALLFPRIMEPCVNSNSGENLSLMFVLSELLQHANVTLANIAAEVAAKLLFSVRILDSNLIAFLLITFLDPNNRQEEDQNSEHSMDIKEVGSPSRLQQLLSLFFPALCLKSDELRDALLGSIGSALEAALDYVPKKKEKSRFMSFPLVKIVDYICSIVANSGSMSNEDEGNEAFMRSSLQMSASLQVAKFLVENEQRLNLTQLRALCKFLGNQEIQLEEHNRMQLAKLKDLIEQLSFIDDSPSLKSLHPLFELLTSIKGYEDYDEEDEVSNDSGDETVTENSLGEDFGSFGETTVEDEVMMDSIGRLSLLDKENANPPSIVKMSMKTRRSSAQSNVSALESLRSPNM